MSIEHEQLKSFQYVAPSTRLFSGADSLAHLQRELERATSERAVVVCSRPIAQDNDLMELVRSALGTRLAGVFSDVQAHSPTSSVEAATHALQEAGADSVIAVGGGSAIVTARAAGILLGEKRDVRELCTSRNEKGELQNPKLSAKKLPQFIIPSTPTTAMAKAGAAVYDTTHNERLALFDPKTRAQAVFLHPAFAASAPDDLVISSSLNTFSMAIEGLTSRAGNPLSDALLMHSVRLFIKSLSSVEAASSASVRTNLMVAAMLCGQGTDSTGAGITTALGHAIGARHHTANGIANAVTLPESILFNAEYSRAGLGKVADAMNLPDSDQPVADKVSEFLRGVFATLKLPNRLNEIGVSSDDLGDIVKNAMDDWFLLSNPRRVKDAAEVEGLLKAVL